MKDKQNRDTSEEDKIGNRILVYDDDPEILTMCTIVLKKFHYQVTTLSKCENVIKDIDSYKPDLILMDLWIPEIGGEKAIELVKGNPKSNHISVLVFSANSDISDICKRVKADGYIAKPFNLTVFINTIDRHIQKRQF